MLVLSRNVGQAIIIGDDITVRVLAMKGSNQVSIGVAAPDDVTIHREEIYERIHEGVPHPREAQHDVDDVAPD